MVVHIEELPRTVEQDAFGNTVGEEKVVKGKAVEEAVEKAVKGKAVEEAVKKVVKMTAMKKAVTSKPRALKGAETAAGSMKKKRTKRRRETFKRYIYSVMKQTHPGLGATSSALNIMNSFVGDILEKLASEASALARYNKIPTLTAREFQSAVRLLYPGTLAKHAQLEGLKAVGMFYGVPDEVKDEFTRVTTEYCAVK